VSPSGLSPLRAEPLLDKERGKILKRGADAPLKHPIAIILSGFPAGQKRGKTETALVNNLKLWYKIN
jgi:hypothetical protein